MSVKDLQQRGNVIARILGAEWRGALSLTEAELLEAAPLLLNLGAGAWAWRQIRTTVLRETASAHELHQAYRMHTLHVALKELEIAHVFTHLRTQGLEPLMGKGWVIARQYPEPGLRPFGDIDFYVPREQYAAYQAALKTAQVFDLDLHQGAAELDDRSFDTLYGHSQSELLGETEVRMLGPEDHLRLLCLHFLREGALRPLWLCDIAVAITKLPPDFDWDYFLSGNARRTEWVISTLRLAHQLLGVPIETLPLTARASSLPRWMVPTVLKLWGRGKVTKGRRMLMAAYLKHPAGVMQALRERWPNAIEATVGTKAPLNNWPRWPFQLGECIMRTAGFARQLPHLMANRDY
jgi:hypothetical protein